MLRRARVLTNLVGQYSNTNKYFITKISTSFCLSDKKKGQFFDTFSKEKTKKVKLYPGFQTSNEEYQQLLNEENNKSQDVYAKKVIEDFYGLNELEYDKEIEQNDTDKEEVFIEEDGKEFSIERAIKILKSENVQDLCCIQIPKEISYADYMIVGSCLSDKHLNSVFITINKKYKLLKNQKDLFLKRKSGKETKWCAIDTGKIVIHLFLPEYREFYDLECLWTCGSEFDEKYIEFKEQRVEMERKLTILEVEESKSSINQ